MSASVLLSDCSSDDDGDNDRPLVQIRCRKRVYSSFLLADNIFHVLISSFLLSIEFITGLVQEGIDWNRIYFFMVAVFIFFIAQKSGEHGVKKKSFYWIKVSVTARIILILLLFPIWICGSRTDIAMANSLQLFNVLIIIILFLHHIQTTRNSKIEMDVLKSVRRNLWNILI